MTILRQQIGPQTKGKEGLEARGEGWSWRDRPGPDDVLTGTMGVRDPERQQWHGVGSPWSQDLSNLWLANVECILWGIQRARSL